MRAATPRETYDRGQLKLSQRDFDGAMVDFTHLIERDGRDLHAYAARAYARHAKMDTAGAIADYTQVIRLMRETQPTDPVAANEGLAQAYMNRGKAKQDREDWDSALSDYEQALTLNGNFAGALIQRGEVRQHRGDFDAAVADYEKVIQLMPEYANGYHHRAALQQAAGRYQQAIADWRRVIQLEPARAGYPHFFIWLARARLGQRKEADGELAAYFKAHSTGSGGDWESKIAAYLLGNLAERDFMAAAVSSDAMQQRALQCEAWYYKGMKCLLEGEQQEARHSFAQSIATGMIYFTEYAFARAELAGLR